MLVGMDYLYFFLAAVSLAKSSFVEEEGVLVLSKNDFEEAQKQFQNLLVEFYSPWCGHCKSIAPEFHKAAQVLKEQGSDIRLAKVDATSETELGLKYNISGYPTFKFFLGNRQKVLDYSAGRHASDFVSYVNRKAGPPAQVIQNVETAKEFASLSEFALFGFLKNPENRKAFEEVVFDHDQYLAAVTDDDQVFQEFGILEDTVVAFKKFDEQKVELKSDFSYQSIKKFINEHHLPLVTEFLEENVQKIFTTEVQLYNILFIGKSHESFQQIYNEFNLAALKFRGKVLFVFVDLDEQDNFKVLEFFGIPLKDCPTYRFVNLGLDEPLKYKPEVTAIDKASMETFVGNVLEGKIKAFYKTRDVPADWDSKPVKVLVGNNFHTVVDSTPKNVVVLFYVPWCGICKRLEPIWEQLGEKYRSGDKVLVAKFDSAENELEDVSIKSFPTIKLFVKNTKQVVEYTGVRTLEAFVTFVESDGKTITLPEEDEEPEDVATEVKDEL